MHFCQFMSTKLDINEFEKNQKKLHLVQILKNVPSSFNRTLKTRGIDNIKLEVFLLQLCSRAMGLGDARGGKRNIHPTGEAIFNIPLAFSMANKNESVNLKCLTHFVSCGNKNCLHNILDAPFSVSVVTRRNK